MCMLWFVKGLYVYVVVCNRLICVCCGFSFIDYSSIIL